MMKSREWSAIRSSTHGRPGILLRARGATRSLLSIGSCVVTDTLSLLAIVLITGLLAGPVAADASSDRRPSILLLVVDTLRADAVSAYGKIEGTTPRLDGLASEGLLYRNAYASAPWTIPSHATLFTGLRPDEHRVAMPGQGTLPESFTTIAERLGEAGYQTAALSENMAVSDLFQLLQGFEFRKTQELYVDPRRYQPFKTLKVLRHWLDQRDQGRPFFLFLNLFSPHSPYEIRETNRFLPPNTDATAVANRSESPDRQICGGLPSADSIAVQRGLYHGDVAAADQTAGKVIDLVRSKGGAEDLIIVATSDHGELFGEDRLMGHEFSLHGGLLQVPLIVHGLGGREPAVIEQGVGLIDMVPSMLRWAGLEVPSGFPGRPLPEVPQASREGERGFLAAYSDTLRHIPHEAQLVGLRADAKLVTRQFCAKSDRVFGDMASLIRYPYKFRWFAQYPPALYDMRWDDQERSNQAAYEPELVEKFTKEIEAFVESADLVDSQEPPPEVLSDEAIRALRRLGYVE